MREDYIIRFYKGHMFFFMLIYILFLLGMNIVYTFYIHNKKYERTQSKSVSWFRLNLYIHNGVGPIAILNQNIFK